jgi:hypothetical protein
VRGVLYLSCSVGLSYSGASCSPAPSAQAPVLIDIERPKALSAEAPPASPSSSARPQRTEEDRRREGAERDQVVRNSQTVAELRPRLKHCFLSYVPGVQRRRVIVEFEVQRDGSASGLRLDPPFPIVALNSCMQRVLSATHFELGAGEAAQMRVPLRLP